MTESEWQASLEPRAMLLWLEDQGYHSALWLFAVACAERIREELPGPEVDQVVEVAEQIAQGMASSNMMDEALAEAGDFLAQLEEELQATEDADELDRLNRSLGMGRIVLAFEQQDVGSVARSISQDLLDWAMDPMAEEQWQCNQLRDLVSDPSEPAPGE